MRLNKKIIVSLVLIGAIGLTEIFGIAVCGNMIPDYKNQIFKESKSDSTRLMFINDEDSSRFYPWLKYNKYDVLDYEGYVQKCCDEKIEEYKSVTKETAMDVEIKELTMDVLYENVIQYLIGESEKNGIQFDEKNVSSEELKEAYRSVNPKYREELNQEIKIINSIFDNERRAVENTDFVSNSVIDRNTKLLYIEDFEYTGIDKKRHRMDLVLSMADYKLEFYRLREETNKTFESSWITEKSTKIINDLDYAITAIEKYYMSSYTEMPMQADYDGYIVDEKEKYNADIPEFFKENTDNVLLGYLYGILKNKPMYDSCISDNNDYILINLYGDNVGEYETYHYMMEFYVKIPYNSNEYNVFSSGDELIIVFSAGSRESSTILYYSLSAERITGISIGKVE